LKTPFLLEEEPMKRMLLAGALFAWSVAAAIGAEESPQAADEAAIRKAAASYAETFNKGDAKALADHWSPDAVYTYRTTGEEVVGRAAISEQFTALFKEQPGLKLEVTVASVQFVSPNVAIEQGTAKTLAPNTEPEETEYSAVNVKRDGKWLLDRVTDKSKEEIQTHYEQLKPLEWMLGNWTDESENAVVELDCNWTKNKNFLTRAFKISVEGQIDFSGMQVIGWDPAAKTIRSWTFDSNGTFAEATWEHRGGPLVHPQSRRVARRPHCDDGQRYEAGGREFLHLADDRSDRGGRTAAEHR
jgi:uncharacterized protein (TIGR02246 family)